LGSGIPYAKAYALDTKAYVLETKAYALADSSRQDKLSRSA